MTAMDRRAFAESVLTAALVPLLGPLPPLPRGWWSAADELRDAVGPGTDLDALADALAAVVRAQYGDRLAAGDLPIITRQIRGARGRAEQMRAHEHAKGDEPDFLFAAPPSPPR